MLKTRLRWNCQFRHVIHRVACASHYSDDRGSRPLWGLIADTHFKEQGLSAIEKATEWATNTFEERGVNRIFMLGDMLNTREMVHVGAQSAAMRWVHSLVEKFGTQCASFESCGVHVLLGNHDMHLKHARAVSSLDALALPPMDAANLKLYREPELIHCDGVPVLMLPYHHDQMDLARIIQDLASKDPEMASRTVAMAHTAIHGAIQNTAWGTTFAGPLGITAFNGLRRTFSGHFHAHQTLFQPNHSAPHGEVQTPLMDGTNSLGSLTYVGSPLQFNFGDLGDVNRGIILYDPIADEFELVSNPNGVRFTQVTLEDVLKTKSSARAKSDLQEKVSGKMVSVSPRAGSSWLNDSTSTRDFETAKDILITLGAQSVRKPFRRVMREKDLFVPTLSAAAKARIRERDEEHTLTPYRFSDFVEPFVRQRVERAQEGEQLSEESLRSLLKEGLDIISTAEKDGTGSVKTDGYGKIFRGDIQRITMENFLGVKEEQSLDIGDMDDGIWYVQGKNGAGKSTLLEALTWCLFGQFLRSEMKADFAINDQVGKNTRVTVTFSNGYEIVRFRKHSELGGSGFLVRQDGRVLEDMNKGNRDSAQAAIDHLLGTNFAAYSKTVVLAEETARGFVQATPAARRQIIEDLLGFGEFELYLKEVRGRLREQKQSVAEVDKEMHALNALFLASESNISSLERKVAEASHRSECWRRQLKQLKERSGQAQSDEELERLMNELGALGEVQRISELASEWREAISDVEVKKRRASIRLEELKAKRDHLERQKLLLLEKQETAAHLAQGSQQLSRVREKIASVQEFVPAAFEELGAKLIDGIVPPIGRQLLPPLLAQSSKSILDCVEDTVECVDDLQELLEEPLHEGLIQNKSSIVTVEVEVEKLDKEMSAARDEELKLENQFARYKDALVEKLGEDDWKAVQAMLREGVPDRTKLRQRMQAIGERKDKLVRENSSGENSEELHASVELARAEELKAGLEELLSNEVAAQQQRSTERSSLEETREALIKQEALLSFWEEGFGRKGKSMRDYVFEENLFELNAVLENVMERLCDDGVDYHDLQTSLSKDFAFNGKDYGKRSSGERKRTALALFFSLVQLTRSRSRHQTEFIMLDECFDALDSSGQDAAHRIIAEMHNGLNNSGGVRKAFVITHSQNANLGHLLRVEKSASGTRFFPEPNTMI